MNTGYWLICFDVACSRRRYRVARLLESHGQRVQKSVFDCFLSTSQLSKLRRELENEMNTKEDKVYFFPLCDKDRGRIKYAGKAKAVVIPHYYLV